jgi:glutamine amidotransferase
VIAIIDYGQGNLRSIAAACQAVGADVKIANRDQWIDADALILPGVGSFKTAMRAVRYFSHDIDIYRHVKAGKPLLGICLGMQLLFGSSDEGGDNIPGLKLLSGSVRRLSDAVSPVPRVGWHAIRPCDAQTSWAGTPLASTPRDTPFYFSHSYACYPENGADWLALSDHGPALSEHDGGPNSICVAMRRGSVFGVQFHPEKSGEAGLRVLREFCGMVKREERAA